MAEDDPSAVRGADNRDRKRTSGGNGKSHGRSLNGQASQHASRPPGQHRENSKPAKPGSGNGGTNGRATPARNPFIRTSHNRQAYAALDLGTNNCRLLIARPEGENFTVIDAFSRVVRLGEGLALSGKLSDDAMERTLAALHVCAGKLRRRRVHLARSVATEACRRAANGAAFIERVRQETGIALDIISAREEARLAVLGCHVLLEHGDGPAMIFDIGGGSTELVLVETGGNIPTIVDWQSVPWGVVSLTEEIGPEPDGDEAARLARYARMRRTVADSFAEFAERIAPARRESRFGEGGLRLLGTSGTVTTLASLHLELPQYDRGAVDGLIMPSQGMRDIADRLSSLSPEERGEVPCIGHDRAELVVAGCAILETILDLWPAERLGVADRGIREGILRSMMASGLQGEQARRDIVAGRGDAR
jgi:exopolyphosphatase/guanosine-5'-triphosphate,3'-diphosphate pyrophosphatase